MLKFSKSDVDYDLYIRMSEELGDCGLTPYKLHTCNNRHHARTHAHTFLPCYYKNSMPLIALTSSLP